MTFGIHVGSGRLPLFAYGSNLWPARLRARVPSAEYVSPARLLGHDLRFHKSGRDGSGKADAFRTGSPEDVVWGALFTLDPAEKPYLDAAEGPGYREVQVQVLLKTGRRLRARMYQARPAWREPEAVPYHWYRAYVLAGARHHGFSEAYLRRIRAVGVREDLDAERARLNRRALGG